jgi:hypothetical protein
LPMTQPRRAGADRATTRAMHRRGPALVDAPPAPKRALGDHGAGNSVASALAFFSPGVSQSSNRAGAADSTARRGAAGKRSDRGQTGCVAPCRRWARQIRAVRPPDEPAVSHGGMSTHAARSERGCRSRIPCRSSAESSCSGG